MLFDFMGDLIHIHDFIQFFIQWRDCFICDTARDDVIKIIQVCIDIKSKSVHGHPTTGFHANGAYLSGISFLYMIQPYSGTSFDSSSRNSVILQSQDDGFFEIPEVFVDVCEKIMVLYNKCISILAASYYTYT